MSSAEELMRDLPPPPNRRLGAEVMKPRRALKPASPFGPQLIVAAVVALFVAFAGVVVLRLVVTTTPTPPPTPPMTSAQASAEASYKKALAKYSAIPVAACPTPLDPNLRRQFYREGQCPQGGRKR